MLCSRTFVIALTCCLSYSIYFHILKFNVLVINIERIPFETTKVKMRGPEVNKEIKIVYSNDLVREAIRTIRYRNCHDYFKDEILAPICGAEPANSNVTDDDIAYSKQLPGCVLLGAYESGTRELTDLLAMHPQIVIRRKRSYQVNYFEQKPFTKVAGVYRNQMPRRLPRQLTVDSSPEYFYGERTPRGIYAMNSSVRLILMVRNPVQRAIVEFYLRNSPVKGKYGDSFYSCAFRHTIKIDRHIDVSIRHKHSTKMDSNINVPLRQRQVDKMGSHIDVPIRQKDANKFNRSMDIDRVNERCFAVEHSVYHVPMRRYLQYFKLDQILIIDADELKRDPFTTLRRVEAHLGIARIARKENFVHNELDKKQCLKTDTSTGEAVCWESKLVDYHENRSLVTKLETLFERHNKRFFNLTGIKL